LRLPQVGDQLDTHAKAWKAALGDANRANLDRFLSKQPAWASQVSEQALREGGASARELAGSFLYDLAASTRGDSWMDGRLGTLRGKADMARTLAYRMEVRLGVVLRMRTILATIAGREYLSGLGIRFGEVTAPVRKARELTRGAASVTAVYPESPASEADLQVGDVILPDEVARASRAAACRERRPDRRAF
jgi:hypothetical protein